MKTKLLLIFALLCGACFGQNTLAGNLTVQQTVKLTGDISPTAISSNQNDYAPTGHATASIMYLSSDAARSITGLAGGADGRQLQLFYSGAGGLTLTNEDNASTAAMRFSLGADLVIPAGASLLLNYDATALRWKAAGRPILTKSDLGLGNADNTSDVSKPVSTAQATAIRRIPSGSNFVFEGDSLTASLTGWPIIFSDLSYMMETGGSFDNVATSGHTLANIVADYATEVYPLRPTGSVPGAWLFVWIGANDLAGTTPSAWLSSWASYLTTARADGFKICVFTVMRRADVNWSREWVRMAINQGITKRPELYDALVDTGNMFDPSDSTGPYYIDGVHMNVAGYTKLAGFVNAALEGRGTVQSRDTINAPLYTNQLNLITGVQHDQIQSFDAAAGTHTFYKWTGSGDNWFGFRFYYDPSATLHFQNAGSAAIGSHTWTDRMAVDYLGAITFSSNAINWASVNKSGSSLADFTTRSATDLNTGTLGTARLPSLVQTSGFSATGSSAPASGSSVEIQFSSYGIVRAYNRTGAAGVFLTLNDVGGNVAIGTATDDWVNKLQVAGGIATVTAGKTLAIKSGSNALAGTVTLTAGAGTISSTAIDANTTILLTLKTVGGTIAGQPYVDTITPATGCTVTGGGGSNTSTYNWVALKVN